MSRGAQVVSVVLVSVVGLGVGLIWKPWVAGLPDGAAFAVGDHVVTEDELDDRNDSLRALYGIQAPSSDEALGDFRKQSAKSMAISIVLDQAVEEHEIDIADEEVEAALGSFLEASFGGDRQAFVTALGNVGTSEEKVLEEIRHQLQLRALLDEVVEGVDVTGEELAQAFEERRTDLATPERRSVSNIVVRERSEAMRIRDELESGADIGALARRHSIDASTRARGGALGVLTRRELLPAVGKAVFAAAPGAVYGPVEGSQGWNVGLVTRVLAPQPARLGRVADGLRASLEMEETYAEWSAWLEEQLREARIEYAESYRPSDPFEISSWADVTPTEMTAPGAR